MVLLTSMKKVSCVLSVIKESFVQACTSRSWNCMSQKKIDRLYCIHAFPPDQKLLLSIKKVQEHEAEAKS